MSLRPAVSEAVPARGAWTDCRGIIHNERREEFRHAWGHANEALVDSPRPLAMQIDARLHAERVGSRREKRTWRERFDALPPGRFITARATSRRAPPALARRG